MSSLPEFIQNYCLLNSQVYRFSNIIRIQASDSVTMAIDKYISHPIRLKNSLRKDSLEYSYETIQSQINARKTSLSSLLRQSLSQKESLPTMHAHHLSLAQETSQLIHEIQAQEKMEMPRETVP